MKKLKSILAIALVATMMFAFAGCSSSNKSSNEGGNNSVKFGLITLHDENSTYDLNFIKAFKAACEATGTEYSIMSNVPESEECYEAACTLVDEGCNIIFADSFGHETYLLQAAEEFPEVEFCHATGTNAHIEQLDNFHNAFASIYEGRYLAGIAAGLKLSEMIENGDITAEEAKMGYVGAFPYAEVKSGYTSFFLGARATCPSVTMEVTFTNSWYDEALEKTAAEALIQDGCVLISQHADSMGAPSACEANNVPNVSYNGSTEASCPNTFIVSSYINWQPYFEYVIGCVKNGEAIVTDYIGTIADGSVCLTDFGAIAPAAGTAESVEAIKANIEAGSVHVFDVYTFTIGGEIQTEILADIDGDFTPETNVVIDGHFAESNAQFRSAPYFEADIDGISFYGN